jgi:hypothetical protein
MMPGHLLLTPEEARFLREELRFQTSGGAKADVADIRRLEPHLEARALPPEIVPILERLLESELASGTLRGRRGDDGERLAIHVYERTPRGLGLIDHMKAVNAELAHFAGSRVLDARCVVPKFGELSVLLTTETGEVMLTFTGAGLEVTRMELGPPADGSAEPPLPPPSPSARASRAGRGSPSPSRARGSRPGPARRRSRRTSPR